MHQQIKRAASYPTAIVLTGVLATLGLSACGGSSGSTTAARTGSAASLAAARARASDSAGGSGTKGTAGGSAANKTNHPAPAAPRIAALRECLQRAGVKLPQNGRGGLFLGGANLPRGVTRAHLQSAMRKCLGSRAHLFPARGAGGAAQRFGSARFRQALSAFASCLRQNGVNVPAPNTSGRGPVFRTKGIDTRSPKFREATKKCRGALTAAFKGRR